MFCLLFVGCSQGRVGYSSPAPVRAPLWKERGPLLGGELGSLGRYSEKRIVRLEGVTIKQSAGGGGRGFGFKEVLGPPGASPCPPGDSLGR